MKISLFVLATTVTLSFGLSLLKPESDSQSLRGVRNTLQVTSEVQINDTVFLVDQVVSFLDNKMKLFVTTQSTQQNDFDIIYDFSKGQKFIYNANTTECFQTTAPLANFYQLYRESVVDKYESVSIQGNHEIFEFTDSYDLGLTALIEGDHQFSTDRSVFFNPTQIQVEYKAWDLIPTTLVKITSRNWNVEVQDSDFVYPACTEDSPPVPNLEWGFTHHQSSLALVSAVLGY